LLRLDVVQRRKCQPGHYAHMRYRFGFFIEQVTRLRQALPKPGAKGNLPYWSPLNIVGATCIKRTVVEARAERLTITWVTRRFANSSETPCSAAVAFCPFASLTLSAVSRPIFFCTFCRLRDVGVGDHLPAASSSSSGRRFKVRAKSLNRDRSGEGNRTLVFSLEVAKFRRATKRRSDNLQRSERLKSLRNFFLSEWLRTRSPSVHRPFAPKAPSRRCYRSKIFMRHSSGVRCAWRPPRTVAVRFEEALDRQRRFGIRRAHHVRRGSHVLPTWLQLKPRKPANSNFVKQRPT
jgi:hypothetical protein